MKDELLRIPPPPIKYDKKRLAIARRARDGKNYYLQLEDAVRMILLGAAGSGKTYSLRGIGDRVNETGSSVVYLLDVKDEFKSSRKEVQNKFKKFLLFNEYPRPTKVITFRPTFFKSVNPELKKHNYWFSIDIAELTEADFGDLFRVSKMSETHKVMCHKIYQDLQTFLENGGEFENDTFETLINDLDKEMFTEKFKKGLRLKFSWFITSGFYNKKYSRNLISYIRDSGVVPAFNFEDFDSLSKDFGSCETFLSIITRSLLKARRREQIPPVWIIADESSSFLADDMDNTFKTQVLESVDRDRRYGVNWVIVAQVLSKIPLAIVDQARYILVPAISDTETIRQCLKSVGQIGTIQDSVNRAQRIKTQLMRVKHSWLILDRVEGTREIIVPLAPLSEHMESNL